MKNMLLLAITALFVLGASSCKKENEQTKESINNSNKFSEKEQQEAAHEYIKILKPDFYAENIKNKNSRSEDPWIEIITGGPYLACGDGSAECPGFTPLCILIVCQDLIFDESNNSTHYTEGFVIKGDDDSTTFDFRNLTIYHSVDSECEDFDMPFKMFHN